MIYEEKSVLRFGIVGCGMIAAVHAQALRSIDGVELVGVADALLQSAVSFAKRFDITAYESYEDMLADQTIDVVCICTPSGFHAQNALDALRAGKHVAVEKPIAMNVRDADEIIETANQCGRLVTVISQLRFAPDVLRLKKVLEEKRLGTLKMCDLYMKYWRDESYYGGSPWKGNLALDGGVLMNQGIHGVDLLRYLVGGATVVGSITDHLTHKIEAPDTAIALLRFDCGALGVVEASTAAYPGFDMKLEIIGDRGYAIFKENRLESLIIDGKEEVMPGEEHVSDGTANDPAALSFGKHAEQLSLFAQAIRGKCPVPVEAEAGRGAVSLIMDIYQIKQ